MADHRATFQALFHQAPFPDVQSRKVERCAYGDYVFNSKGCYLCFELGGSQDCGYCDNSMKCTDSWDCSFSKFCQLCSECLACNHCYNCHDCHHCDQCTDCSASRYLRNCQSCFGCVGLRYRQHHIFNQAVPADEYATRVAELQRDPEHVAAEVARLLRERGRPALTVRNSTNVSGDFIFDSHDLVDCYNVNNNHNSAYLTDCLFFRPMQDCLDIDNAGSCELSSNCHSGGGLYNCHHCTFVNKCTDCLFSDRLRSCEHCFGCVYLQHKKYYIFNAPVPPEEYPARVAQLLREFREQQIYDLADLMGR